MIVPSCRRRSACRDEVSLGSFDAGESDLDFDELPLDAGDPFAEGALDAGVARVRLAVVAGWGVGR